MSWITRATCHRLTVAEISSLQRELSVVLTDLEMSVPLMLFTIVFHSLFHLCDNLLDLGPMIGWWMFVVERHQGRIVHSLKSHKNPELSILRSYLTAEAVTMSLIETNLELFFRTSTSRLDLSARYS